MKPDIKHIDGLVVALTVSRVNEKRKAAELKKASDELAAKQKEWSAANDELNAAQKTLDSYLRDTTTAHATELAKDEEECP